MTQGSLNDVQLTAPVNLRYKYAVGAVGEPTYTRDSEYTTHHLGVEVVRNALRNAGLDPGDRDGILNVIPPNPASPVGRHDGR